MEEEEVWEHMERESWVLVEETDGGFIFILFYF